MSTYGVINDVPYTNIAGGNVEVWRWDPDNPGVGNVITSQNYQVVDYLASFEAAEAAGNAVSDTQKYAVVAFAANYGSDATDVTDGPQAKIHKRRYWFAQVRESSHQTPFTVEDPDDNGGKRSCCVVISLITWCEEGEWMGGRD